MEMIECDTAICAWFLCSIGPPSRALAASHMEKIGMPLHDAAGVTVQGRDY